MHNRIIEKLKMQLKIAEELHEFHSYSRSGTLDISIKMSRSYKLSDKKVEDFKKYVNNQLNILENI